MNIEKQAPVTTRLGQVWRPGKPFYQTAQQTLPVLAYGGLGAAPSPWQEMADNMSPRTQLIIGRYAGMHRSIDDLVDFRVRELEALDREVILMPHSMGVLVAAQVAARMPAKVKGIIALAPTAPRGVLLPYSSIRRTLKVDYLRAMVSRSAVSIQDDDLAFLRDGSSVFIDPVIAGRTLWELGWWGYEAPRFSSLKCPTKIIFARDDGVIPERTARKIAKHHGIEPMVMDEGGHFFFSKNHGRAFHDFIEDVEMTAQDWS